MIYYCMSDIHGCLSAFNDALELVLDHLDESDTILMLMGDYIHGGEDNYGVLDRILDLQRKYGSDKVIALMGNHEEMVCEGRSFIDGFGDDERDDKYITWMSNLPRYHTDGKTIFVHAGIDEETEEYWEYETNDYTFTEKYPAQTGHFYEDYKIVAGHVHISEISGDLRNIRGVYFDGESHYYIDADTIDSGFVNVLKVDTDLQEYYDILQNGVQLTVLPAEDQYE